MRRGHAGRAAGHPPWSFRVKRPRPYAWRAPARTIEAVIGRIEGVRQIEQPLIKEGPVIVSHAGGEARSRKTIGQGAALCGLALTVDDLVAGRLGAPLQPGSAVKTRYACRMVHPPSRNRTATPKTFMRWIEEEAGMIKELMAGFPFEA